jgi:chlorite dismutase
MNSVEMNSVAISKEMAPPSQVARSCMLSSVGPDTICSVNKSSQIIAQTQLKTKKSVKVDKQSIFDAKNYYSFSKKSDALSFINSKSIDNLKLFSEDLSATNGSKKFIVSTDDNIYYLSKNKNCNMYENYEAGQKVKLILDIDYKQSKGKKMNNNAFDDLLKRCIETVNDKLAEYL